MGWAYGMVGGKEVGYGVTATCEHPYGCDAEIDRGLSYACGRWPIAAHTSGCTRFVCDEHQFPTDEGHVCAECAGLSEQGVAEAVETGNRAMAELTTWLAARRAG